MNSTENPTLPNCIPVLTLGQVLCDFFRFLFRKLAMRYAIIFLNIYLKIKTKLTVFNKQKFNFEVI